MKRKIVGYIGIISGIGFFIQMNNLGNSLENDISVSNVIAMLLSLIFGSFCVFGGFFLLFKKQ